MERVSSRKTESADFEWENVRHLPCKSVSYFEMRIIKGNPLESPESPNVIINPRAYPLYVKI